MHKFFVLYIAVGLLPMWGVPVLAADFVIDFEGFTYGTIAIDQFDGVTFSGTTIITDPVDIGSGVFSIDSKGNGSLGDLSLLKTPSSTISLHFDQPSYNISFLYTGFSGTLQITTLDQHGNVLSSDVYTTDGVIEFPINVRGSGVSELTLIYRAAFPFCCFAIDDLSFNFQPESRAPTSATNPETEPN